MVLHYGQRTPIEKGAFRVQACLRACRVRSAALRRVRWRLPAPVTAGFPALGSGLEVSAIAVFGQAGPRRPSADVLKNTNGIGTMLRLGEEVVRIS